MKYRTHGLSEAVAKHNGGYMSVHYFYCTSCGYEDYDVDVKYSRATTDSEWYFCPICGEESSHVDVDSRG